jgi:hypothetical protein
VLQHRVAFDLAGHAHTASDNYVELYPREKKQILITLERPAAITDLRAALRLRSLADTY